MKRINFALLFILISSATWAGDTYELTINKKTEEKKSVHWSLQEWLEQKNRNSIMDMWLMMHTPTPYEYFISGSQWSYTQQPSQLQYTSYQGGLTAFATVVGLSVEHEHNTQENYSDVTGQFLLRLFGNAYQGTHLVLGIGQRTRSPNDLRQPVGSVDLNIYANRHFGISCGIKNYGTVSNATLGNVSETASNVGIFIDFGSLRVAGNYINSSQNQSGLANGTTVSVNRTGTQAQILWFF